MITYGTFKKGVIFEISQNGIALMEPYEIVRNYKKYKAPSSSIIFENCNDEIKFTVGKDIEELQLK